MNKVTVSLYTFIFLIIFSLESNGQLAQGTWLVGGTGMYSVDKDKLDNELWARTRSLDMLPNIGYFFWDKIPIGLKLSGRFANDKYSQPDGTTNSSSQSAMGFGPFARYYFLDKENRMNIFASTGIFYTINTNSSNSVKSKSLDYGIACGTVVFFNSAVGLELLLEYKKYKGVNHDSDWETTAIAFKLGFQFHLEKDRR